MGNLQQAMGDQGDPTTLTKRRLLRLRRPGSTTATTDHKEEGYDVGLTTNIDVLNAQRDLGQARTDYLKARYEYILDSVRLEKIAATLDDEDVRRINTWLQRK